MTLRERAIDLKLRHGISLHYSYLRQIYVKNKVVFKKVTLQSVAKVVREPEIKQKQFDFVKEYCETIKRTCGVLPRRDYGTLPTFQS